MIREEKPDILYSRVDYASSVASLAVKLSGNKRPKHVANEETILSQQLTESRLAPILKLWLRNRYGSIDCIVAPCEASKQDLISNFGIAEDRVKVIYNSIDFEAIREFQVSRDRTDKRKPTIVSVGSLRSIKGHRFLLRALKDVVKSYPDCQLEILGEGAERASLAEYAKELGIEDNVHMPGVCVPYARVAEADLFVLPSIREGLPTAILEAMALKTPAIASSVGGIPEVIEDGKNGFLVRPREWEELARKILNLLNDRSKSELFAENSFGLIAEKFDIKENIKKLEALFSDCCST